MIYYETLLDLVGKGRHSRYFNHTRSHHLYRRIRLLALLLGVIQPAWIAVDAILLPADMLEPIALCRVAAGAGCLMIFSITHKPYDMQLTMMRLVGLIGITSLFQVVTNMLLYQHGHIGSVAGYDFFPYMIMSMLAIFPLTMIETVVYSGFVLCSEVICLMLKDSLTGVAAINTLWLLTVLAIIAGWAAVNQLNMLLGLYRQATRDPLTGLSNRRQSMEQLQGDMRQCREKGEPLSVLLFDLDHFKRFNDTYGHAAGDIVLKTFARLMRKQSRSRVDLAGRYGGEEFLMVLPGMDRQGALEVAEQLRQSCHKTTVKTPGGEKIGFTTSIGLAEMVTEDDIDSILARSDEALYKAKDLGRDQVYAAEQPHTEPELLRAG